MLPGRFHPVIPVKLAIEGFGGLLSVAIFLWLLGLWLHKKAFERDMTFSGLYGVVGRMGAGKSYFMAMLAYRARKKGRNVYSNFPIKGCVEVFDWHEIIAVPNKSLVLIDEAHLWWPSSAHTAPVEVRSWITQLRKRGITCVWASQSVVFVARWLRLLGFGVWEGSKRGRGHQYRLFDPFTAESRNPKRQSMSRVFVVRKRAVMAMYDTHALVRDSVEWGDDVAHSEPGEEA
jgi:hypothetical protein